MKWYLPYEISLTALPLGEDIKKVRDMRYIKLDTGVKTCTLSAASSTNAACRDTQLPCNQAQSPNTDTPCFTQDTVTSTN